MGHLDSEIAASARPRAAEPPLTTVQVIKRVDEAVKSGQPIAISAVDGKGERRVLRDPLVRDRIQSGDLVLTRETRPDGGIGRRIGRGFAWFRGWLGRFV